MVAPELQSMFYASRFVLDRFVLGPCLRTYI